MEAEPQEPGRDFGSDLAGWGRDRISLVRCDSGDNLWSGRGNGPWGSRSASWALAGFPPTTAGSRPLPRSWRFVWSAGGTGSRSTGGAISWIRSSRPTRESAFGSCLRSGTSTWRRSPTPPSPSFPPVFVATTSAWCATRPTPFSVGFPGWPARRWCSTWTASSGSGKSGIGPAGVSIEWANRWPCACPIAS